MPLACCTAPGLIQTNTKQLWGQELQCTINPVVLQLILILFTVILVQSSKTRSKHTKSANCNLGVPWPRDQLQFKKRLVAATALLEFTLPDPSDFCYIQGTLDRANFLCASLRCHFGTAARAPLFQKCSSGLSSRNSWCFPGWDQLGWPVNTVLFNRCQRVFQCPLLNQPAQPELPAKQNTWWNFPLDFMFSSRPRHTNHQKNRQQCPNPSFIHSAIEGHRELTADFKARAALYNSDENLANTPFSKAWILLLHCSLILNRASWGRGNEYFFLKDRTCILCKLMFKIQF